MGGKHGTIDPTYVINETPRHTHTLSHPTSTPHDTHVNARTCSLGRTHPNPATQPHPHPHPHHTQKRGRERESERGERENI